MNDRAASGDGYALWQLIVAAISAVAATAAVVVPIWIALTAPAPLFKGDLTINDFELPPSVSAASNAAAPKGYIVVSLRSIGTARASNVTLDVTPLKGQAIVKSDGNELFKGAYTNRVKLGDMDLRQTYEISLWTEQPINRESLTVYVTHAGGEQFLYDKAAQEAAGRTWANATNIGWGAGFVLAILFFFWLNRSEWDEIYQMVREISETSDEDAALAEGVEREVNRG